MKKIFFLFIFLFFIGSNVGKIVAQEIDPVLLQKNTEFDSSVKKREKISVKKNIKKTYSTNEKVKIELFNQDLNDIEVDVKNDKGEKVDVEVTQNDILGVSTVSFNPPPQFRPGEYKIILKDQLGTTVEQDFVWGVLALNPNKSIYNKDETASLAMAVLDNLGKMVCDAKVKLTITNYELRINDELSTENGKIVVNPECNSKEVTTIPDYETKYKLGGIGVYNLELTAITSNGTFVINDKIEVKDNNDFEVERISATRIFPKNEYPMTINIVANRDFSGGIYEEVPENFEISEPKNSQKYSRIIDDGKKKKIFWEIDIKKGEKVSLGYQYRAPVISPQFYLVGPLLMTTLTDLAFSEGRQWQIAADDTGPVQIRQEINIIDGTVTSGGTDPATINIDTTKYSGTETYYFEIIANKGAGTTLTVNLSTGNTNSVSIGVSDTTDVRVRKQFTPQTGSFDYRLNLTTGSTPSVKVARIIILQSDTEITATQTQVEIGNKEIGLTMATSNDFPFSQGIGNSVSATTGTATVAWPTHVSGDVALLFIETIGGTTVSLSTPNGFVAVTNSPQATGVGLTGTQLNVYWARATSSSMASPVVKASGDHIFAQIITYRNVVETGDPWNVTIGTTKPTASTTTTFGAVTTTVDNTLVVVAAARDTDSAAAAWTQITNGNLQGINEKTDGGTTSGNGGGLLIANGNLPTAGSTGTMTSTVASSINATMTIALKGKVDTNIPATIKIQEDDGAFGGWADKVTILGVGKSSGSIVHSTSVSFTPTTGRNYRIVKTIDNSRGHSLDIYNAKIIIDQSDATKITKLEPQYLMLNTKSTSIGGTLGFANLWDSTEWIRTTNTYKHAADSLSVGTSAQLVDINNSNTLVTGSKIMGVGQTISGNLTMPTTGHNLDTWLLGSGEVDASRVLVQVMINALSDPMPPSANSFQRKTFYDDINSQYWKMSFGGTGVDSEYSNNGTSWSTGSTLPYATNDFSVWYAAIGDTEFVFVAITDNYDIKIRQGVLTASSVTWNSNVATIFDGAGVSDNYSYPYISLDNPTSGNPHLWVSARYYDGTNYVIKTRSTSSTAEASPSTWTYNSATQISDNQTNSNAYANIVPLLSGDMYSAFVRETSIEGCRWNNGSSAWQDSVGTSCSGVSGSQDSIDSTTGNLSDNFSTVSDFAGNVHLALVEDLATDQVSYKKLAVGSTTWSSSTLVSGGADNNDAYISLTSDSTNNYLYAFWIDTSTNNVYYSFCPISSGCDSDTEWVAESGQETSWYSTGTNTNLTSNYTGAGKIFAEWSNGTAAPYTLIWDDIVAQVANVGPAVDQIMRHGMSFINGVRQNFTF